MKVSARHGQKKRHAKGEINFTHKIGNKIFFLPIILSKVTKLHT